jgi:HD superfamily phosphodiesterase
MKIKDLPQRYEAIWKKCIPLFLEGRDGDDKHAAEVVEFILRYSENNKIDLDVFVPVAMMHDIGHSAILPEHFKYLTGGEKIVNGKIVHMLTGAKIAKKILESCNYNPEKTGEIVEIISTHDGDQIKEWNLEETYNTETKRLFHDIDCLDRYSSERIEKAKKFFNNDTEKILNLLRDGLDSFFTPEIEKIAKDNMKKLEEDDRTH